MPSTNTDIQRKGGFFHSLGKVLTEESNLVGNELYKSSHNVKSSEVWMDTIPYCATYASASSISDGIIVNQVGTDSNPVYLFPLTKSNYQTWFMDTGTPSLASDGFIPSEEWVKPLINPSDVPNDAGAPSFGFEFKIYRPDGVEITYDFAYFEVDYFGGLVRFDVNRTPKDPTSNNGLNFQFSQSGFESVAITGDLTSSISYIESTTTGGPRAVAWQYVGQTLADINIGLSASSGITISNDVISVDLGTQSGLTFSDEGSLVINIDDQSIKINQENQIYVSGNSVYEWNFSDITSGSNQPTGVTISNTPLNYSTVKVTVNGQVQILGGTTNFSTSDCYFFDGVSVKDIDDISIGDELYWNGNVANYDLSTDDKILFIYEI